MHPNAEHDTVATEHRPLAGCPLCGTPQRTGILDKDGFPIVRCSECRLVYVDAERQADEIQNTYGREYFTGGVFHDYIGERDERVASGRALCAVVRRAQPGGRLLDVGCAAGFFLEAARPFFQVTGVELSPFASEYARRETGLDVRTGDIADVELEAGQFDVVTLWNTIEHVGDPVSVIAHVRRAIARDGLLVLTTGDVCGPLARRDLNKWGLMTPPEHLFFFDPSTITRLLAGAGFEVRRIVHDGLVATSGPLLSRPVQLAASVLSLGSVMTVFARPSGKARARLVSRLRPIRYV
jgi:2-polyprenyl-3-methyl-5-hydroxy-6-metoxy-1,4-benzoquinol methylase